MYLVSALPILLLIVLALAACAWVPYRLLPSGLRARAADGARRRGEAIAAWCASPIKLSLAGIALSIVVIQFVMRQPFLYSNLLVARELPASGWLRELLLTPEEGVRSLYFAGLVAATAVTAAIVVFMSSHELPNPRARLLWGTLVAIAAIQFLLLPVNYGFLEHRGRPAESREPRGRRRAAGRSGGVARVGGQRGCDVSRQEHSERRRPSQPADATAQGRRAHRDHRI